MKNSANFKKMMEIVQKTEAITDQLPLKTALVVAETMGSMGTSVEEIPSDVLTSYCDQEGKPLPGGTTEERRAYVMQQFSGMVWRILDALNQPVTVDVLSGLSTESMAAIQRFVKTTAPEQCANDFSTIVDAARQRAVASQNYA